MAADPVYQPITADQFLAMDFGTDRKFELSNGVIQMMTGGSDKHAHVSGNIYLALRAKLRGTKCRPFNSDMGVAVSATTVRYPDISIVCRDNWADAPETRAFNDPRFIFEVLSPSTTMFDQGTKLDEYRELPSVEAVIFVDPINQLTRTFSRMDADHWFDSTFAQPHEVVLPSLGIRLTEADLFTQD